MTALRVLVIGPTGMLGRTAVRQLLAEGHDVTGLARNEDRAAQIAQQGAKPIVANLFDANSLVNALHNQEAVLNLSTHIPTLTQGLMGRGWAENDRVRREGSATLVEAALADGNVRIIVQEGVNFYYQDGGDTLLTEESPIDVPNALRSSIEAHENVAKFATEGRIGIRLRIAILHGNDPITNATLKAAKFGMPLIYGNRNGWTTAIHPADAARGAVATLNAPSGIYNVGATPVRKNELGAILAEAAGIKKARAIPASLLNLTKAATTFSRSLRVTSAKLTETTGWQPKMPQPSVDWLKH